MLYVKCRFLFEEYSKIIFKTINLQKELRKKPDVDTIRNDILAEFEENNLQIAKEYDALKKKYEQLMARERKAREEIRNLRSQLIKRF